jgi:glycerophosphoryl diester phosphodiesterase
MKIDQRQLKISPIVLRYERWSDFTLAVSLRTKTRILAVVALPFVLAGAAPAVADFLSVAFHKPLVIGHRGAGGYLPDHTLESYALAIELGADFIEPDLVATKDGHLIARHEPNLTDTTDVSRRPEFANRKRIAMVDGFPQEGWFTSDFTLVEIKKLRAVQPLGAERPTDFDGMFEIPTLEEVIALAKRKAKEKGRTIGIYPETKHPTYHKNLQLALEPRLVKILNAEGWDRYDSPVFIQSFEQSNLKELRKMTRNKLVQLVDANDVNPDGTIDFTAPFDRPYDWTVSGDPKLTSRTFGFFTTDAGLKEIKTYADGIGPWKVYIVRTRLENGQPKLFTTDLIERAHKHDLLIHTWTFRNEQRRLLSDYKDNPLEEYLQFYDMGIDGVFSDFPDTAVAARVLFKILQSPGFARCLTEGAPRIAYQNHSESQDCFDLK